MIHELKPDFIHGTETWLDSSIENAEFLPDGYALHRRDRSSGTDRHGGVFFAYRKDLPVNRRQELETNSEMLWCQLDIQGRRPILFGTLYKPKHDDIETVEDLAVMLENINNHSKLKDVVIQGDLNQPNIDWVNKTVIVNHPASKTTAERLLQTVQEHGLEQVVDKPTRLNSILDLVLTNNSSFIKNVEVIPGLSDHEAVLSVLNGFAQVKKKPPHKIYLKRKADVEKIKQDMKIFGDSFRNEANLTVQEKWDMFDSKIKQVMEENVPTKMSSNRRNLPWFTRTHRRMSRKKGRMYSKAKRTGDQKDWEEYKEFCRTVKRELNHAKREYVMGKLTLSMEENPKAFWSFIKKIRQEDTGVADLKVNNKIISDDLGKAEALSNQFAGVFTKEDTSRIPSLGRSSIPDIPDLGLVKKAC
ncbi:uncharacterized protein [Amphiura filiformis]|uniref:uncharacterized protein n=1 Tax=Amphiura filiformis TaxID=82378 RepID=UPI003B216085